MSCVLDKHFHLIIVSAQSDCLNCAPIDQSNSTARSCHFVDPLIGFCWFCLLLMASIVLNSTVHVSYYLNASNLAHQPGSCRMTIANMSLNTWLSNCHRLLHHSYSATSGIPLLMWHVCEKWTTHTLLFVIHCGESVYHFPIVHTPWSVVSNLFHCCTSKTDHIHFIK